MEFTQLPPRDAHAYAACYCEENIYKLVEGNIPAASLANFTVVFLSNSTGTIPVFSQKAQKTPLFPVIWDYHVVLVHHPGYTLGELLQRPQMADYGHSHHYNAEKAAGDAGAREYAGLSAHVYDFDSTIPGFPCSFGDYYSQTFSPPPASQDTSSAERMVMVQALNQEKFRRYFRLVPASVYLDYFCSERGHMKNEDGSWKAVPPPWPVIKGSKTEKETFVEYIDFKECEEVKKGDEGKEHLGVFVSEETLWDMFHGGEPLNTGIPDFSNYRISDMGAVEATS
ncbi:Protein N-terminal glutamine amidohydrolase [Orbilia brochopaga]|uniref:Protein N-terminal glutamine amidohydrolase n=1 Tax=Orbilia brochopaga TaxID=3140254 RepID=A0AAV9UAK4_9PEZI